MASANYSNLPLHLATGAINFSTASFKALLHSTVPTEANLDAWVNRSDVVNEVTGTGYTAGGTAVTATVSAVDTTNNRVTITFSNPSWATSTITALAASVYLNTGTATTDKLITMADFGATVTSTNGTFSVTFSTPLIINR